MQKQFNKIAWDNRNNSNPLTVSTMTVLKEDIHMACHILQKYVEEIITKSNFLLLAVCFLPK